jgi:hypothetical protein
LRDADKAAPGLDEVSQSGLAGRQVRPRILCSAAAYFSIARSAGAGCSPIRYGGSAKASPVADESAWNAAVRRQLMDQGRALLARTKVRRADGALQVHLKLVFLNPTTTNEEIDATLADIVAAARELAEGGGNGTAADQEQLTSPGPEGAAAATNAPGADGSTAKAPRAAHQQRSLPADRVPPGYRLRGVRLLVCRAGSSLKDSEGPVTSTQ